LQNLRKAIKAGHSIAQVSAMKKEELKKLAGGDPEDNRDRLSLDRIHTESPTPKTHLDACLAAVINLDPGSLELALSHAAVSLTRPVLLNQLIVPLVWKIGDLWAKGSLKIVNENLATSVLKSFLWDILRSSQAPSSAPKIIVATPVSQWHEIGALIAAVAATNSGWESFYFGPNLPAEEIAAAAEKIQPRIVALSIVYAVDNNRLIRDIKKLHQYLSNGVKLIVGGRGADTCKDILDELGIRQIHDLEGLRHELESI
jgi:methanogenic corrinoid protein MtbC1